MGHDPEQSGGRAKAPRGARERDGEARRGSNRLSRSTEGKDARAHATRLGPEFWQRRRRPDTACRTAPGCRHGRNRAQPDQYRVRGNTRARFAIGRVLRSATPQGTRHRRTAARAMTYGFLCRCAGLAPLGIFRDWVEGPLLIVAERRSTRTWITQTGCNAKVQI